MGLNRSGSCRKSGRVQSVVMYSGDGQDALWPNLGVRRIEIAVRRWPFVAERVVVKYLWKCLVIYDLALCLRLRIEPAQKGKVVSLYS